MDNLCYCGSGKAYENCCKGKQKPNDKPGLLKKINSDRMRYIKENPKICLYPNCKKAGIYSHSISQKAVLEKIAINGHVYLPIVQVGKQNTLVLRGIETQASGFHCFCVEHDNMFHPLDEENAADTDYIRFLYAYRIFSTTYYKVLREKCWFELVTKKYDLSDELIIRKTYEDLYKKLTVLDKTKNLFDTAVINEDYSQIKSFVIHLNYKIGFSSATSFCPKADLFGNVIEYSDNKLEMLYITTSPDYNATNIIISYLDVDHQVFAKFFNQLAVTPTKFILKYLNNLFPYYCENIAISPALKEEWSDEGIEEFETIINYTTIERYMTPAHFFYEERNYNMFKKI